MNNNTNWTPFPDDNLLGITDKNLLNEYEAKGVALAELEIYQLNVDDKIDAQLILKLHKIAFGELYEWAGKWRKVDVLVGKIEPPSFKHFPNIIYQFLDNLHWLISTAENRQDVVDCLIFAHYEFVKIHPFNNGNGRMGRLLLNLIAMKFGFKPIELYHREGDSRKIYISALQNADEGNYQKLYELIDENLVAF